MCSFLSLLQSHYSSSKNLMDGKHRSFTHSPMLSLPFLQSYYSSKDLISGKHKAAPLKGEEVGVVDQVG